MIITRDPFKYKDTPRFKAKYCKNPYEANTNQKKAEITSN